MKEEQRETRKGLKEREGEKARGDGGKTPGEDGIYRSRPGQHSASVLG